MQAYRYTVGLRGILLAIVGESEQIAHLIMDRRESMSFVIVCTKCWQKTKYDALSVVSGEPCDKCGELL
jgi:hypothetical protein